MILEGGGGVYGARGAGELVDGSITWRSLCLRVGAITWRSLCLVVGVIGLISPISLIGLGRKYLSSGAPAMGEG